MKETGRIRKGIGGFYYVEAAGQQYECKARGLFRKQKITPAVGDMVRIEPADDESSTIVEILPRKNNLIRPPVANLDQLVVVVSTCEPAPSVRMIDKIIAIAEDKGIEPVVVFSKTDLRSAEELVAVYAHAGLPSFTVAQDSFENHDALRALLPGKLTVFTGNSGVGKSTLLNALFSELSLETGDISQKLGRGRHTTRQVELYPVEGGGYVADTPGFSTLDIERYERVQKENLPFAFREFAPYLTKCQFTSCAHIKEKGCAVLRAVEEGEIEPSRHESYVSMYNEVKDLKEWEMRQG